MRFEVLARAGAARRARLTLAHGVVETPVFMPVGTYGAVKAMSPADLDDIGAQIILGNTFHLWLRPGIDVVAAHGGLHGFAGWQRPIYQTVFVPLASPANASLLYSLAFVACIYLFAYFLYRRGWFLRV